MLLSDAIRTHIAAKRAEGRAPGTVSNHRYTLRDLLRFIGNVDLRDITADDLDAWLLDLQSRLAPGSVWYRRSVAAAFFTHMVRRGHLARSPLVTRVPPPRVEPLRNVALRDWEVDAILEACADLREEAIVRFLLDTGCRASALGTITRDNLDLPGCTATAVEKGGREVALDFSTSTSKLLRKWLRVRGELEHECVFVSAQGTPLQRSTLYWMLRRLGERAGVEDPHPHRWRHTVGKRFAEAGAPLTVIQAKLNHRSPQMTARYMNQSQEDVRRYTEKLARD
jgi:integrase/recombinase XerD